MENLWDEALASGLTSDLEQRVYSSRLLGANPDLVLHGGGNTSVKSSRIDIFGNEQAVLYVKGSGWDLATIKAQGFSPVLLQPLLELATLDVLSDLDMARELRKATLDPEAPNPSVEAILHGLLPYKFVDHTHADSIIALTNTPSGEHHIREAFGDSVVVIPYVMPGFVLAKAVAERLPSLSATTKGIILMNHGAFTFGSTAKEAYDAMIGLVRRAEAYLEQNGAWSLNTTSGRAQMSPANDWRTLALLRQKLSEAAGSAVILHMCDNALSWDFARRPDLHDLALQGPATPDHVLRTKPVPLVGNDIHSYVGSYSAYFAMGKKLHKSSLKMLDPAPRVIINPELGVITVGTSSKDAKVVADIYQHTIKIIGQATLLERWQALPSEKLFEVEYWDLEQAKLISSQELNPQQGQVVLLLYPPPACHEFYERGFFKRGAAVITVVTEEERVDAYQTSTHKTILGDASDASNIQVYLNEIVNVHGGVDHVIWFPTATMQNEGVSEWLPSFAELLALSPVTPSITIFQ